jgi:HEPN domain-containing protein
LSAFEHSADVIRWWSFALEDLEAARAMHTNDFGVPRQVCWLAQQAAEKALKSVLVSQRTHFPRTHDLDLLRNLLPAEWQKDSAVSDLAELSQWAVESRYPGDWPIVTVDDARRAIEAATAIMTHLAVYARVAGFDLGT